MKSMPSPIRRAGARGPALLLWSLAALALAAPPAAAAEGPAYLQPSAEVRAVLDAPGLPAHLLSPDQRTLAVVQTRRHRSIAELARPWLGLAGVRIDPAASGPQLVASIESLTLRSLDTAGAAAPGGRTAEAARTVALPVGGAFHQLRWSPDSRRFLLHRRTPGATELWVGDVASGRLQAVPGLRLNAVLSSDIAWLSPDEIVVLAVAASRGAAPVFGAPSGPAVQQSLGLASPERTQQDLLRNGQDEALFTHHATAVLQHVNLATGALRQLGAPGLYSGLQRVGSGGTLLTERLVPPFSYQVEWSDFARQVELRDTQGTVVRDLGSVPLRAGVPVGGVVAGAREHWASPLEDAAVYWVEALDGGDPRTKLPHRDRLMRLEAPYQGAPREVHRSVGRLTGLRFLEGTPRAIVTEYDFDRRWITADLLSLDGSVPPRRLQDRSVRDRYADPGTPLLRVLPNGRSVVRLDGTGAEARIWFIGAGASPQGDRPFLDSLSLADGRVTRRFRAGATHHERVIAVLADGRVLTSRESATEPPNLMLRSGPGLEHLQAVTSHVDPTPQLRQIRRELVSFQRADGVAMSFWRYLPADLKPGERRPTLVWAYPVEYTDGATAGQVSGSSSRFATFGNSSPLMLVLDGYVVLMDATMPVVGSPQTVNDSFVEQITANAKAIVEQAVALGTSDAAHLVVGGHSYGAFMTANLLAHTDLFKAGIARSGAYNRSLTPFGFQSERRTYWEAQAVYQRLSPFNYAHQLKEPLLLIHGEVDDNPGTFPIQSQRLYQALAGTGGTVRYVSLPHESHNYSARESLGHTLREMSDWMKLHTRDPRAAP